jgi:hypothetical protein
MLHSVGDFGNQALQHHGVSYGYLAVSTLRFFQACKATLVCCEELLGSFSTLAAPAQPTPVVSAPPCRLL